MAELDKIIDICNKLQCKMIVVVPSMDIEWCQPTIDDIRKDAVEVLREMVKKCDPHGIKLSIEFIGQPTMTINRFEDALAIVEEVGSPNVGITLDQYHFHGQASSFESLEKADGKRIFIWHLNGKIGFEGDVCTMEVFRPDYYKLTNEENIKQAAERTRAHVAKYWDN